MLGKQYQNKFGNAAFATFWFLAAILIGPLYLREPWLGDDLDYWSFAIHFHDPEVGQALDKGFHALRWPVWGVIWFFQHVLPKGLPSYYAQPVFYYALGASVMLLWARKLFAESWRKQSLAMVIYLFHPLLEPVLHRPMPDLSEGVLMAAAMFAFWRVLSLEKTTAWLGASVLCGLLVQLAFANRFTGLIVVPVMVLSALFVHAKRALRVTAVVFFGMLFFCIEGLFYYSLHGDFLHSLTANSAGRGRPGTEPLPLWWLPFRFFDTLWEGNVLKVIFNSTALIGLLLSVRSAQRNIRICGFWALWLYLGYSCAIQGLDPLRPLIRDGERFIASLAWPLSLLSVLGISWIYTRFFRDKLFGNLLLKHSRLIIVLAVIPLAFTVGRKFAFGFDQELIRLIAETETDTVIATHTGMRDLCALADYKNARKLSWRIVGDFLEDEEENYLANAQQVWLRHKELWLSRRKLLEQNSDDQNFASPFYAQEPPLYFPMQVIALNNRPDLWFFDLRRSDGLVKKVTDPRIPQNLTLSLRKPLSFQEDFSLPKKGADSEGVIGVYFCASASRVHPLDVDLEFFADQKKIASRQPLVYFNPMVACDAAFCDIPAGADVVRIRLRSRASQGWIQVESVKVFFR